MVEFHRRFAQEALEGVHGSHTYAAESLPWFDGEPGYEDWYLVEASFALDTLNQVAAGGPAAEAHRAVAALTGSMAAGLYRQADASWRRQMVLGPVPELRDPAGLRKLF